MTEINEGVEDSGLSRRSLVRNVAAGAAVAWAAPAILSIDSAAAQTSPGTPPVNCGPFAGFDYEAEGWSYSFVPAGTGAGFESGPLPGGFLTGRAAFGTQDADTFGCTLNSSTDPSVHTAWTDPTTDLLLRRDVCVGPNTTAITVHGTVDDDYTIYWNGNVVATEGDGGCPALDEHTNVVSQVDVVQGAINTLALRVRNGGGGPAYVDVRLTATN